MANSVRENGSVSDEQAMRPVTEAPVISVVIPVYRGEDCLTELHRRLIASLEPTVRSFEIVLVEDCGPDGSWEAIRALARRDPRVRGMQFSRNFGQHFGITAGIDIARGDWIVVMDCDLQDRPEEIPALYARAQEGFDIVLARRHDRTDGWWRRTTSLMFYGLFRFLTDLKYDGAVGNFRIISRDVANSFRSFREQLRFFGGIVAWLGYRVGSIDVQHDPRFAGTTTYTWGKLIDLGVQTIVAYSDKPLRLGIRAGFSVAFIAFVVGTVVLVRALVYGTAVTGWASVMVSMYFLSGLIIGFMGLLGLYLGRVFDEVKRRPLYVVREKTFAD